MRVACIHTPALQPLLPVRQRIIIDQQGCDIKTDAARTDDCNALPGYDTAVDHINIRHDLGVVDSINIGFSGCDSGGHDDGIAFH